MLWKRFMIPMMNQDGGIAGGDAEQGQADLEADVDAQPTEESDQTIDALEGENKVTFTPEQKAVIAKMISSRLNEVKKQYEGTEAYKEVVEMIGDIIGYKDINLISQHLKTLHAQHQARQMGMTPQGYQMYQAQQQQMEQQVKQTKRTLIEQQFEQMKANPKYSDADLYKDQIVDLALNSGLSVQQAYWAVAGEHAAQRLSASAAADAEHRTLNSIANARTKQVQGGDSGAQKSGPQVTPEIKAAAEKVGMDPVEYMQYMNIITLDQARALRSK